MIVVGGGGEDWWGFAWAGRGRGNSSLFFARKVVGSDRGQSFVLFCSLPPSSALVILRL